MCTLRFDSTRLHLHLRAVEVSARSAQRDKKIKEFLCFVN